MVTPFRITVFVQIQQPPNFYRSNTVSLVSDDFIPVCKSMILVIYLYIFAENTIITDFNAFKTVDRASTVKENIVSNRNPGTFSQIYAEISTKSRVKREYKSPSKQDSVQQGLNQRADSPIHSQYNHFCSS